MNGAVTAISISTDFGTSSILCNTSLNDKGEPIINRVDEAMNFALRKGIKVAYINGLRVELMAHEQFENTKPAKRRFDHLGWITQEEKDEWLAKLNPFNVPKNQIGLYIYTPEIYDKIDLTKKGDVRTLAMLADMARKNYPNVIAEKNTQGCS